MDWQRPEMDGRRDSGSTVRDALRTLGQCGRDFNSLGVRGRALPLDGGHESVLAFARMDGRPFLCLASFADEAIVVDRPRGLDGPGLTPRAHARAEAGTIELAPYEV